MIVRISAPHFCAGLVVGERAAPILKYMQYWTLPHIEAYCRGKGWTVEVVDANVPEGRGPRGPANKKATMEGK